MTVMTRPTDTAPTPATLPDTEAPPAMTVQLANALVTSAPMSMAELQCVVAHYRALIGLLDVSGPTFSAMRRHAIDMHNRGARRINGVREEARRRALEDDDRVLEIER